MLRYNGDFISLGFFISGFHCMYILEITDKSQQGCLFPRKHEHKGKKNSDYHNCNIIEW